MSVLQTIEDQVKEYGAYQCTNESYFIFVDYKMDEETTATIVYLPDGTLESIRFW